MEALFIITNLTVFVLIAIVGISMFWRFATKKKRRTIAESIDRSIKQLKRDRQIFVVDDRYPNGARRR